MNSSNLTIADYTVGWICALPLEVAAALELLDEEHGKPGDLDISDPNSYAFGRLQEHNIVVATLPDGQYGTTSAATVAAHLQVQFKALRFGLMVGIGGAVPSPNDIRLGDIAISKPDGQNGGVVQYDMGKAGLYKQFIRTGHLNSPPPVLSNALNRLRAEHLRQRTEIPEMCTQVGEKLPNFANPGPDCDDLYKAEYPHVLNYLTCEKCSDDQLVPRKPRSSQDPVLHFGTIASGNQVIKDGIRRDELSRELGGVLCYEMEAAGLMNNFPCIVIRGICDYADSHKNKGWQPYAAVTAAACAKELLSFIPAAEVKKSKSLEEQIGNRGIRYGDMNIGTMNSGGGPQFIVSTISGSQFSWNNK